MNGHNKHLNKKGHLSDFDPGMIVGNKCVSETCYIL